MDLGKNQSYLHIYNETFLIINAQFLNNLVPKVLQLLVLIQASTFYL